MRTDILEFVVAKFKLILAFVQLFYQFVLTRMRICSVYITS